MFTRNAEPVSVWQSVQWQMVSALGSTSASKVISPQWQCPSIFTRLVPRLSGGDAPMDQAKLAPAPWVVGIIMGALSGVSALRMQGEGA